MDYCNLYSLSTTVNMYTAFVPYVFPMFFLSTSVLDVTNRELFSLLSYYTGYEWIKQPDDAGTSPVH